MHMHEACAPPTLSRHGAEEGTGGDPELEPDVKPAAAEEQEEEEEDEADPEVAKRKAKQLSRKGISFQAKDDGKVVNLDPVHWLEFCRQDQKFVCDIVCTRAVPVWDVSGHAHA